MVFFFCERYPLQTNGFWRVLKSGEYHLISMDHRQTLDHPTDFDLTPALAEALDGSRLKELKILAKSGDVILSLDKDVRVEIFVSSVGYETYQIKIDGHEYIGIPGGNVGIVHSTDKPNIFTTKMLK